jgi:hypothetical protein
MSQSAALVPVPFYPPVRTAAGSRRQFGTVPERPLVRTRQRPTAAAEPDGGAAYNRDGFFIADPWIGTRVDVYA